MKNKAKWLISLSLMFGVSLTSCSDLLETDSTRQNIDPQISEKTDSVFYAFGILQAMQQLADQYVLQGEMRGDLLKVTQYTDNNLRQLASYTAGTENKYDSAYVYYRVINNCNYYIAHCDTNLYNGSTNVVMDKYVATKAIRAWAYLQLGRNYERVPFFTEPLTQISQIDKDYPELTLEELVARLAPDLEQYTGYKVPTLGYPGTSQVGIGSPNWESTAKQMLPSRCFIPVDVILGDMYLEAGNYDKAARYFVTYLTKVATTRSVNYTAPLQSKTQSSGRFGFSSDEDIPDFNLISASVSGTAWSSIFARNSLNDIVTYIPMASTAQNGCTTQIPYIFGFDYYATPEEKARSGAPYIDERQVLPSDIYNQLSDSTEYYYFASHSNPAQINPFDSVRIANCGDMRLRSVIHQEIEGDSTLQWIDKYKYANVVIYRLSGIWLKLAEAFNRLGMSDAAFAILKDGVSDLMLSTNDDGSYKMSYLTEESRQKLLTDYPLLSEENINLFSSELVTTNPYRPYGIHTHGAGKAASDYPGVSAAGGNTYNTGKSPYTLDRMVGKKFQELNKVFGDGFVGATKQDTINAVEDLICDEYALELAFEGNRYSDLLRLARHKDRAGLYGGNFGDLWLEKKLGHKGWTASRKYLPFK